jgi:hypothetical protein
MHLLRIVLLSAAMTGGLAQADALDGLFDSLARHCEASPALVAVLRSLGQVEGEGGEVRQPAKIPD